MPNFNWDDNTAPLVYLITIRTYGTWLHGDERSSVDLRGQNVFGTPRVEPIPKLNRLMEKKLAHEPFIIEATHRGHIEAAIKEVCKFRSYELFALNVRTNQPTSWSTDWLSQIRWRRNSNRIRLVDFGRKEWSMLNVESGREARAPLLAERPPCRAGRRLCFALSRRGTAKVLDGWIRGLGSG